MINYEYPLACTLQEVILWVRYSHFWIPSGGYDCGLNLLAVRSEGILYRSWPRNMWITDRIPNFETYGLENQKKTNQSQPCDFMPSYEFQESNLHLKLLKSFMVVPFSHSPFAFFSFFSSSPRYKHLRRILQKHWSCFGHCLSTWTPRRPPEAPITRRSMARCLVFYQQENGHGHKCNSNYTIIHHYEIYYV